VTRFARAFSVALLALAAGCAPPRAPAAPAVPTASRVVEDTVASRSLRGNPLGDSPRRGAAVYLPPGYAESELRYPVVYLLHGFAGDPRQWTERFALRAAMDSLIAAGAARPMIVVAPDGGNAFGGSFYANSPATGRWGDFVARDLVRHVDRRYRTVRRPSARGIGGWSMGGYGALRLATEHPETFGAVYALSPCCLGAEVLEDAGAARSWPAALALRTPAEARAAAFSPRFYTALAAVLSPDASRPLGVAFPFVMGGSGAVLEPGVLARWRAATPALLVQSYRAERGRLQATAFDAGRQDGFAHIPTTTRALHRAFEAAAIPHTYEEYEGTHGSRIGERLRSRVLPFFSRELKP
jgi:S-formylglutathione hydrolase FrmB